MRKGHARMQIEFFHYYRFHLVFDLRWTLGWILEKVFQGEFLILPKDGL